MSVIFLLGAFLAACTDTTSHARAVFVLLDTSGTYAKEIAKAQKIIDYLLAVLNPGDSLSVARIDSASFSEKDIVATITFNDRPSVSNAEKRAYHDKIEQFSQNVTGSGYTDITGALLQATEYLEETGAGRRYIFLFSDLKEDIKKGHIRDFDIDFSNISVIALNVTKLKSDNVNPAGYLARLERWRNRVEAGGGKWTVVHDLSHLDRVFSG